MEANGDFTIQDNAPCHPAKSVKGFSPSQNITDLPWPPKSPNINPIETGWSVLKQKFMTCKTLPKLPKF